MTIKKKIPNIIHKIWFGLFERKDYKEQLVIWKKNNPKYEVKFWWKSSLIEALKQKEIVDLCNKNNIILCDIDEEKFSQYPNLSVVNDWLKLDDEKVGTHRYAAASDIWRWSILEIEGGHYNDTDIESKNSWPINIMIENGCYQSYEVDSLKERANSHLLYGSDLIGSIAHHPVSIFINEIHAMNHKKTFFILADFVSKTIKKELCLFSDIYYLTGMGAINAFALLPKFKPYLIKTKELEEDEESEVVIDKTSPFYGTLLCRMDSSYCLHDKNKYKKTEQENMKFFKIFQSVDDVRKKLKNNEKKIKEIELQIKNFLAKESSRLISKKVSHKNNPDSIFKLNHQYKGKIILWMARKNSFPLKTKTNKKIDVLNKESRKVLTCDTLV